MAIRRKSFTKVLALGLAFTLGLGLCGCDRDENQSVNNGGNNNQGGGVSSDPSLAKEYVYRVQDLNFGEEIDGMYARESFEHDGQLYMIMEQSEYTENAGNRTIYTLVAIQRDGSVSNTVTLLDTAEGSAADGTEGETDSDSAAAVPGNQPEARAMITAEVDVLPEEFVDEGYEVNNSYEYTSMSQFAVSENGEIYALKNYYYEDYSDPENYISRSEYDLVSWDLEGNLLNEISLDELKVADGDYLSVNSIFVNEDNSVSLMMNYNDYYMIDVAADGTFSEQQTLDITPEIMYNVASDFIPREDGTALLIYYNEQDNYRMYAVSFDPKTRTLGEEMALPDRMSSVGYSGICAGTTTDLVVSSSDGIYTYNLGDQDMVKVMDYINSDISTSGMDSIVMLSDTSFIASYYDQLENTSKAGLFTYVAPEDIPDKATIILGGIYVDYDLKRRAVQFNKESELYRIVLREYNSYNTSEDYTLARTRLNSDIIAGNMPDILIADMYNLPMDSYASKGLLADVDALIAQDEELSQEAFVENVFEAYRRDGKLYYVIPSFYINSMLAKQSLVGTNDSFTLEAAQQALTQMAEGAQIFDGMTKSYFMDQVMNYCGYQFVDVSTGKCSFDSEEFIKYLEFTDNLPTEIGDDYYSDDYWMFYESQYREDKTLLSSAYISSVRDLNRVINGTFGEPVSFVGFPSDTGKGSTLNANSLYVLSAKSANLEGAWEFVRYYLTDEYQNEYIWGLPTNKEIFDRLAQEATQKPYYEDENGEKIEYDDYFYMNDEQFVLEPMTQEIVDQVVSFIESVDRTSYYSEDVSNIIREECESYFSGQRNAQDIARNIQSRVQLYVNENQ